MEKPGVVQLDAGQGRFLTAVIRPRDCACCNESMQKLEEALRYLQVAAEFLAAACVPGKGVGARCGLPAMSLSDGIASVRAAADARQVDLPTRMSGAAALRGSPGPPMPSSCLTVSGSGPTFS